MSTNKIWASTQDFGVAYAQIALIKAHADVFSKVRDLNFGLSLHLHSNFMYASREGLPEPPLLADAISTKISCTCLQIVFENKTN